MPIITTDQHFIFYKRDAWASNHYPSKFTVNNVTFETVEQFYFYCKMLILGDTLMAEAILREPDPAKNVKQNHAAFINKELLEIWGGRKSGIMKRGLFEKYLQNKTLRDLLLATEDRIIVEGSKNMFWGCGVDISDPDLLFDNLWRGRNELGKLNVEVREYFKKNNSNY